MPRTRKLKADPALPAAEGLLPCMAYIVIYHALAVGALVVWHSRTTGVLNPVQLALAIFCTTNAWICVCEQALLFHISHVKAQHRAFTQRWGDHVLPSPLFLFERVPLRRVLSLKYWAIMWSTYATLDPSYVDTCSFGFCIDSGNGLSSLLPSLLFGAGMSAQLAGSARWLGMLGLASFWQMLYGTVLYFFQYVYNGRYVGTPTELVYGVVVVANMIWIGFPALGMWACHRLVLDGDFSVFGGGYPLAL